MKNDQLAQALLDAGAAVGAVGAQLTKALGEISTDIQSLKDQLANAGGTDAAVDDALTALVTKIGAAKAVAQSLDDIVPDATPEEPGTPTA